MLRMKLLGLVGSAIVAYAIIAAFALGPRRAPARDESTDDGVELAQPHQAGFDNPSIPGGMRDALKARPGHVSLEGLPYRCAGMQIQRVDWMDKYKQSIDEIATVGADTVKFVVDARQENTKSSRIYL